MSGQYARYSAVDTRPVLPMIALGVQRVFRAAGEEEADYLLAGLANLIRQRGMETDDVWECECGHIWNPFETGGRCPSCATTWEHTWCLECDEPSKHHAWYRTAD